MTLVSDNIRYLRKLNGLTQEQFSRKINIKRSLLGAYEEGRANPNQQNIQAIAKSFNTTVELLTRQDLRKLRETPNLRIPLGQSGLENESPTRLSAIRSDGKFEPDEEDPFQHPDFPDVGTAPDRSSPLPNTPEPRPLSSVLTRYYRTPDEATEQLRPTPPVITAPVRPGPVPSSPAQSSPVPSRPAGERVPPAVLQAGSPVDRLFDQPADSRSSGSSTPALGGHPAPSPPGRRSPEVLAFNNVYEGSAGPNRIGGPAQAVTPMIPVVMQPQFAEYNQRYQQTEYLHRLPAMHLPTLPEGHYRAFEAGDDVGFPGALLVGQFVRNWFDIADGKLYVLLINRERSDGSGIYCRRVYNQVKVKGTLLLTADRADVPNREVLVKEVLEVWEIQAFVSQQLPLPTPNTDRLRQLVDELRFEVERL